MRHIAFTLSTAIALLVALTFAAPVAAGSSGVLASGTFTLVFGGGSHRTFSFEVDGRPAGGVTGQAQWVTRGGDSVHIDIDCYSRVGNQAIVGGTSNDPDFQQDVWVIQDNPDIVTTVAFTGPDDFPKVTCDNLLAWDGLPDMNAELDLFGVPISQGNLLMRG